MFQVSIDKFKEELHYDKLTGRFLWLKHKKAERIGLYAEKDHPNGYRQIYIFKRNYLAHRLAWVFSFGSWPENHIDHINEDKKDNRIGNLRDVPQSINLANQKNPQRNNTSGYRGVSFKKRISKFHAQIFVNKKYNSLGYFDSAEEAHKAYLKFKEQI
jgi:hypothetical protein